ncbi:hypothetical protein TNCV_4212121 [Trichonephila clavipes]|nr:hypothetical protein TNCV_4212121 [Trichonephila clavipes]
MSFYFLSLCFTQHYLYQRLPNLFPIEDVWALINRCRRPYLDRAEKTFQLKRVWVFTLQCNSTEWPVNSEKSAFEIHL